MPWTVTPSRRSASTCTVPMNPDGPDVAAIADRVIAGRMDRPDGPAAALT